MYNVIKTHSFVLLGTLVALLSGCGAENGAQNTSSSAASNGGSSLTSSSLTSSSADTQSSLAKSSSETSSAISSSGTSSSIDIVSSSSASSWDNGNNGTMVTTLATAAAVSGDGLTLDKDGNVFVGTSKGHTIYRVTPSGTITLFATLASGSANGSDFDSKGNLFVANESAGIIHKISPDGTVSDFLTGLDGPAGIYIDEADNLIVGMFGYAAPAAKVLKITPEGAISTLASDGGLTTVVGVAGDGNGRYFAANFYTGEIFEVTGGQVKQIGAGGTRVNHIKYSNGYIYTPHPLTQEIVRLDLLGNFEFIAGIKSVIGTADGAGATATFSRPNSIDISADGKTLFVLEFVTGNVRAISLGQ